jgi:hypothetical protein
LILGSLIYEGIFYMYTPRHIKVTIDKKGNHG